MPDVNINVKTKGAKKAESTFKKLGHSLTGMAAGAISIGLVAKAVGDLVKQAGLLQGVERAFDRTTISLDNLREATRNTISDFELMQRAVQAKNLGVPIEQLADLFKFASIRARETGESVDYLVNSIVTGIGRKSVLILDNLGISATEVNAKFKEMGDFGAAVGEIVNRELQEMDENIAPLADSVDQLTTSFSNLYDEVAKVVSVAAGEGGLLGFFTDITNALADYVSFWYGDGSRVFGEANAIFESLEQTDFPEEEFASYVQVWATWATTIADVTAESMEMVQVLKEVDKITGPSGFLKHIETTAEKLEGVSTQIIDTFDYIFTETLIREQNFADAMVAGFRGMLERMVAEMAAKAAVFGVLNFITGGSFGLGVGGIGNFITGGLFSHDGAGLSPRSSGSTVNINMPNVAMINSKSIRQIKQAISRDDRLH
jgi:hypothetical protein